MEIQSGILIKNAVVEDIEFVVEAIVCAEKGNGNFISYCRLFNISETEFRKVVRKILEAGIRNFEFSLENFKIAMSGRRPVAAYGAWLEGKDGISSGMLKISALKSFLSKESIAYFRSIAPVAEEITIKRQTGTFQFESIYILEDYRGKNIGKMLVQSLLDDLRAKHPNVGIAQVQVIKQNSVSLQAHLNYGFTIAAEKTSSNPEILNFYSGKTRVILEKKIP
jgi:GNAT superfamily N-acetyltransferase